MTAYWSTALGDGRAPSDDQIAAITAPPTGRRSVDAGAGTGKTSTLALRALYLIESGYVRADQLVVVTFTRKAAAEIASRIADTIDRATENGAHFTSDGPGVRCTTIHALASDIRSENAFDLGFDAPPRAVGDAEAHALFHDAFQALLNGRLDVDASAFPLAENDKRILERDLGKLALRLKNHGISPDRFETRALAETQRFRGQTWGQLYTVGQTKPRKECRPGDAVSAEAIAREADLERANVLVVAEVFREFDRRLHRCGAATYGDLIGATCEALRPRPELVRRLRERWRYVLLDESQDTSDLQLAFLETLFGRPGDADATGMMLVGDGRQAIYGFNGAGEGVMQRLAEDADEVYPLVVNRRSHQEIVDAGHAVLTSANVVVAATPRLHAHKGAGGMACVRVQNFGAANQQIKERVELEAEAIAREVERLLADGARQRDIAILVRRRTHAAIYLRKLNMRGISAALDRRSGLFVADEIRDALAWMAWLLDPNDRQAAVRVLQSPLCGLNDASMIALAASHDWLEQFLDGTLLVAAGTDTRAPLDADTRRRLTLVRELLVALLPNASLPLSAAMATFFQRLPIAASYVHFGRRENADTIGAQAIVNLANFEALAREFATDRPGARLRDFAEDVDRRILYDDDVPEVELDLDGVRVLTVHQAKGLEWPYVFVACATNAQYGTAEPSDRIVAYDLKSGAFALKADIDGNETFRWLCSGTEHDIETGRRLDPAPRKEAARREQARVFYVALTRAQKRVYVTVPAPLPKLGVAGFEAPYVRAIRAWAQANGADVELGFDAGADVVEGRQAPLRPGPAATFQFQPRDVANVTQNSGFRPRISFTSIAAFETCPRQARYRYRLLLPDLRDQRPRFVGLESEAAAAGATSSARFGSLVHRALELWGRTRIEPPIEAEHGIAFDDAFASAVREFDGISETDASRARTSGAQAVSALTGYSFLAVEEPFELRVGGTLVVGTVDSIVRRSDGTIVVIDYKTGRTAGEKYDLQLALYREVAERRYPGETVEAAILRLDSAKAAFEAASALPRKTVERAVSAVGSFTSDEPRVGSWCEQCPYNGSGCQAAIRRPPTL